MDEKYIKKYISGLQKHEPEIYEDAKESIDLLLSPSCLPAIQKLFVAISSLGFASKKETQPLLAALVIGMCKQDIQLISMNSSALIKNSKELRIKPQYERLKQINEHIQSISAGTKIKMTYLSLLPDFDSEFPLDEYDEVWEKNKNYIEKISKVATIRLSAIATNRYQEIEANLSAFVNMGKLQKEIERHATSYGTWLDFAAPPGFSQKQIFNYTITGLILEEVLPWSILLDIQKKRFPFEQPFYNFARKKKMPIVYCGQMNKKG